jgi:Tfp pilus assembly protein PilX
MFDNLNNSNQSGQQPVDDIFAETDNALNNNQGAQAPAEITAQRVGLTAAAGLSTESLRAEPKRSGSGFKIAIILMVVVILGLLGFLAYNKFFKAAPVDTSSVPVVRTSGATSTATAQDNNATTATNTETTSSSTFVANIPSIDTTASEAMSPTATTTTEINTEATTTVPVVAAPVDSDSDGLTDAEEVIAGTNINLIDTDNDGLSDYEEVKIYKTNPLVADTDGDGYSDGQEVRGGYNPNGAGKMPGNLIK